MTMIMFDFTFICIISGILALAGAAGITYYFNKTKHSVVWTILALLIFLAALFVLIPIVMQPVY